MLAFLSHTATFVLCFFLRMWDLAFAGMSLVMFFVFFFFLLNQYNLGRVFISDVIKQPHKMTQCLGETLKLTRTGIGSINDEWRDFVECSKRWILISPSVEATVDSFTFFVSQFHKTFFLSCDTSALSLNVSLLFFVYSFLIERIKSDRKEIFEVDSIATEKIMNRIRAELWRQAQKIFHSDIHPRENRGEFMTLPDIS